MSELKTYGMNDPEVGDEYEMYKVSDVDKVIAELEESNKKEVEQLLIEIAELKADYKEACDRLQTANLKLEEERRWRKFPDEKPKWGEEVIVVDGASKQYIVRFSYDMKWISWGNMNTCESKYVKYWMPLPSAPKEEK